MGLKPRDVDALTPAELVDLVGHWKRMHPQRGEEGALDAPSDDEAAAVREAEKLYG